MAKDPSYIEDKRRAIGAYITKLLQKEPRANRPLIIRLRGLAYNVICVGDDEEFTGVLVGALKPVGEDGYALTVNLKRKDGPIIINRREGIVMDERASESYTRLARKHHLPIKRDDTETRTTVDLEYDPNPRHYPFNLMDALDIELGLLGNVVNEIGQIKKVAAPTKGEIEAMYKKS